ncbi:MAG: phosphoribosylglycinamide formyltransferase [Clostridiales bacterium]|nr:phosphoribosylglycinamide formyltransferase [Clostridiales bacterium]
MIRVAVLVSGGGSNLQAILDEKEKGNIIHGELSLILSSNQNAYALKRGEKANIPTQVLSRKEYPSQQDYDVALISILEKYQIDFIVLAGFLNILSSKIIQKYPKRIINVHPSLIPSFCGKGYYGLKVHEEAIHYGVKVTGATVHYVNEIPDGGEIIFQKAVEVLQGDTSERLQKRVMEQAEWVLLPKAVERCCKELWESRGKK